MELAQDLVELPVRPRFSQALHSLDLALDGPQRENVLLAVKEHSDILAVAHNEPLLFTPLERDLDIGEERGHPVAPIDPATIIG